jgi:hypothetical protein
MGSMAQLRWCNTGRRKRPCPAQRSRAAPSDPCRPHRKRRFLGRSGGRRRGRHRRPGRTRTRRPKLRLLLAGRSGGRRRGRRRRPGRTKGPRPKLRLLLGRFRERLPEVFRPQPPRPRG